MTRKILKFILRLSDMKPIFGIGILFVGLLVYNVSKQIFEPIKINPNGISKRETQKQLNLEDETIKKAFLKIEIYNYNLDSCKYELVAIEYRRRSNLDSLQSWFDTYR